jgi:hypothetical protein
MKTSCGIVRIITLLAVLLGFAWSAVAQDYEAQLKRHEQAAADNPNDPAAAFGKAVALNRLGEHAWAWRELDVAVSLGIEHRDLPLERGWACVGLERWREAVDALTPYVEQHPEHAMANLLLGRARMALGDYAQAGEHFDRAGRLDATLVAQLKPLRAELARYDTGRTAIDVPVAGGGVKQQRVVAYVIAWLLGMLALFYRVPPRRAALATILTGHMFIPNHFHERIVAGALSIHAGVLIGIALCVGIVLFDRKRLARLRPSWFDLPIALYLLFPLVSGPSLDHTWQEIMRWGLPYLAGRLYLCDERGLRDALTAVVIAGLAYVPIIIYESIVGPKGYILGVLFGYEYHGQMVRRLGGWRPEGFFNSGLVLCVFMAWATVAAVWLATDKNKWRLWKLPRWLPAIVLLGATLICRGMYGYAILAAGLCAVAMWRAVPLRLWPALLMIVPALYVGLRYSGAWDGRDIVNLARRVQPQRISSITMRIDDEQRTIDQVHAHDPWLGFRDDGAIMGEHAARTFAVADGWWVHIAGRGGAVWLGLWLGAFGWMPLVAIWRGALSSAAWGAVILIGLNLLDALHNQACLPIAVAMIGGIVALGGNSCGLDKTGKRAL